MNRQKLARRTAHAQVIRDRHNPPYRVVNIMGGIEGSASTRDLARAVRRAICEAAPVAGSPVARKLYIERRTVDPVTHRVNYVRQ